METNVRIYSLNYREAKTYIFAALFVVGNIVLPQLCHLLPQGGWIFLPIYFFTLVGSYKYGMKVGLLTAILSPIINSLLFGMPVPAVVPSILFKSIILAIAAGYVASRYHRVTLLALIIVVLTYQIIGTLAEWVMVEDFFKAIQDFRIGVPGMLLQIFGGYALIKYVIKK
jgi:hypothetical protein